CHGERASHGSRPFHLVAWSPPPLVIRLLDRCRDSRRGGGNFAAAAGQAIELIVQQRLHAAQVILHLFSLIEQARKLLVEPLKQDDLLMRPLKKRSGGAFARIGLAVAVAVIRTHNRLLSARG